MHIHFLFVFSLIRWLLFFFLLAPLHFNVYNLVQFFLPISRHYIFAFELVVLRIKMRIFFISFAYSLDVHNSPMPLSCSREKCERAGEGKKNFDLNRLRFRQAHPFLWVLPNKHKNSCSPADDAQIVLHIFCVCVFHMYIIEKSIHHGFWCYRHRNVRPNSACNLPTGKHETKY